MQLVTEYESLMFWRRTAGTPTPVKVHESTEEWAGLVAEMKGAVKENVKLQMDKNTTATQEELKTMQGKLEIWRASCTLVGLLSQRS